MRAEHWFHFFQRLIVDIATAQSAASTCGVEVKVAEVGMLYTQEISLLWFSTRINQLEELEELSGSVAFIRQQMIQF